MGWGLLGPPRMMQPEQMNKPTLIRTVLSRHMVEALNISSSNSNSYWHILWAQGHCTKANKAVKVLAVHYVCIMLMW